MKKQGLLRLPAGRNMRSLTIHTRKRHPNRALTEAQIRVLLSSIDNIRDDALIRLGLSAGLRVSEVVTIRTSDIDFDRGLIKIWDEKKRQMAADHADDGSGEFHQKVSERTSQTTPVPFPNDC